MKGNNYPILVTGLITQYYYLPILKVLKMYQIVKMEQTMTLPTRSIFDNPFINEQVRIAGIELESRVTKIEQYINEIQSSIPTNNTNNEDVSVKAPPRSFRYSVEPNGFITELVTVAVTYCPDGLGRPACQWDWQRMLSGKVPGESIRVVEDVGFTISDHEIEWLKHMETQVAGYEQEAIRNHEIEREAIVARTRFTLRSILNRYEAFKNSWNQKSSEVK